MVEPLGAGAQAADLAQPTARSSPRRPSACPKQIGGARNWDYRYTWIRDASFTLYALMRLGYTEEAGAFMQWIEARCHELNPDGSLQIMYGIDGRHELPEETLRTSRATRARGRCASATAPYDQLQLDIYGELMDSVYLYNKYGAADLATTCGRICVRLIDWVCAHWQRARRGHLGGARRAPGVPLLARDVLGRPRPRHPAGAASARSPRRSSDGADVRDAIYDDIFDELLGPAAQSLRAAQGREHASTPPCCSCRW